MKLGSTRQAIHDALSWGYLQRSEGSFVEYLTYLTRIEKSPCGDSAGDFLEAAYICAAINSLTPHISGWLKFAYGPDGKDMTLLGDILSSKLRFDQFPMTTAKKHQKLLALSLASVEDMKGRVSRDRQMTIDLYAAMMGVDPDNWARDGWREKREVCLNEIQRWDAEGVGQISRMVKSLRGGNDEGQSPSEILEEMVAK